MQMDDVSINSNSRHTEVEKLARKAAKKAQKAEKRAKREGNAPESAGRKPCDLCERGMDLLIRCQVRHKHTDTYMSIWEGNWLVSKSLSSPEF